MGISIPGSEYLNPNLRQSGEVKQLLKEEVEVIENSFNDILYKENLPEENIISIDEFENKDLKNPDIDKDLDDSFYIVKTSYGWLLKVSIALPSELFSEYSEIEKQARIQTTSVYYESHVVGMLPRQLANGLASLAYDKERLALTCEFKLSKQGNLLEKDFYKSRVKNINMFNYNDFTSNVKNSSALFHDQVINLLEFTEVLRNKRKQNIKSFDDAQRKMGYLKKNKSHIASKVVEEIMIFTNREVAKFMLQNNIPAIYRNHMPEYMGKEFDLEQMLRAEYLPEMKGHFALNMAEYLHFTSPIRRYPDLYNHRNLVKFLESKNIEEDLKNKKIIIPSKNEFDLCEYINNKQLLLDKGVIHHNIKYNESKEKNKVKYYIRENKLTKENIEEKEDFDLEINIYFNLKNNIEIPDYLIKNLEKRLESKIYNKELLYILAFSKNDKLIEIFNKYFNKYNMRNSFVDYFRTSEFISDAYQLNFKKVKYVNKAFTHEDFTHVKYINEKEGSEFKGIRKKLKGNNVFDKYKKKKSNFSTSNSYFINIKNIRNIFSSTLINTGTKTESFNELIEFIIKADINFLK